MAASEEIVRLKNELQQTQSERDTLKYELDTMHIKYSTIYDKIKHGTYKIICHLKNEVQRLTISKLSLIQSTALEMDKLRQIIGLLSRGEKVDDDIFKNYNNNYSQQQIFNDSLPPNTPNSPPSDFSWKDTLNIDLSEKDIELINIPNININELNERRIEQIRQEEQTKLAIIKQQIKDEFDSKLNIIKIQIEQETEERLKSDPDLIASIKHQIIQQKQLQNNNSININEQQTKLAIIEQQIKDEFDSKLNMIKIQIEHETEQRLKSDPDLIASIKNQIIQQQKQQNNNSTNINESIPPPPPQNNDNSNISIPPPPGPAPPPLDDEQKAIENIASNDNKNDMKSPESEIKHHNINHRKRSSRMRIDRNPYKPPKSVQDEMDQSLFDEDDMINNFSPNPFNGNNTNDKNVNVQTTLKTNNKYDEINPDPSTIETTAMLSQRLNECVSTVHHNTKWAKVLDISSDWKFDSSLKKQIENLDNADAFTIPILSPIECNKLIELTELYGYEDCGYPKNYRSNTRMITNDPFLAAILYQRIKKCLPIKYYDKQVWTICGLNERFRWCKYVKGQKFGTHCDARFHRSLHEKSFYTVNIYLNDGVTDFKGGTTKFFVYNKSNGDLEMRNAVVASPGLAIIFNQHPEAIEHNGEELYDGVKYLMRTDVMYKMIENEKDNNKHILSLDMFLSIKNGHDEIIEKIKILSMAYKLDKTEQIKMIVYCLLKFEENDTKTLIESIKKYSNVLKTIISVDYAKIFLAFIEELIMIRNKGDGLWNKSYKIFECLYDEEILDEDEINEWYSNVDNVSRIIDDEQAKLIRQKTLPFIQWLQEADDGNND